jgi:hypothetical protein
MKMRSTPGGLLCGWRLTALSRLQVGQSEVLIDQLPGMPDGVDSSPTGGYCEWHWYCTVVCNSDSQPWLTEEPTLSLPPVLHCAGVK